MENDQNNSMLSSNCEKSEIKYEEIRVTDSFSIVGNGEATRNSNYSSVLLTSRNALSKRASELMVELQSVDSERKAASSHRENQEVNDTSQLSMPSNQQKDINDLDMNNNMVSERIEMETNGAKQKKPKNMDIKLDD